MAKRYWKISDITDLTYRDLNQMTREEALKMYKVARNFAVQRERNVTRARQAYKERKGDNPDYWEYGYTEFAKPLHERVNLSFNYSEAKRGELIHELVGYRDYLKLKTGTIKATERREREIIRDVFKNTGYHIPRENFTEFFDAYKEISKEVSEASVGGKYEMWRKIGVMMEEVGHITDFEDFRQKFIKREFPTHAPENIDLNKEKARFWASWDDLSDEE